MSDRNILFIVNPTANGKKTYSYKSKIERYMNAKYLDVAEYKVVFTKNKGDAVNLAKFADGIYDTVVAVGGDGTIKEVVSGIMETEKLCMGIIPAGTGNDFASGIEIDDAVEKAIDKIIIKNTGTCDVGTVNGEYFINIATVGFDALVVHEAESIKKRLKSAIAYKIAIVIALLKYNNLNIEVGGKQIKRLLIAIGIGRQYGGGFPILPFAEYDDGKFDICSVGRMNRLQILRFLPSLTKGKHIYKKNHVKYIRAKEMNIRVLDEFYLNLDGEILHMPKGTYLNFRICDKKVKIII